MSELQCLAIVQSHIQRRGECVYIYIYTHAHARAKVSFRENEKSTIPPLPLQVWDEPVRRRSMAL